MAEVHRRTQAQEALERAGNMSPAVQAQIATAHATIYLADEVKALREAFETTLGEKTHGRAIRIAPVVLK